jgi:hypothetical protein
MHNKLYTARAVALTLALQTAAWASSHPTPTPTSREYPRANAHESLEPKTSHDLPENDPSPQPQLKRRVAIPQLVHALEQATRVPFQKASKKSKELIQKWTSASAQPKPTYAELLKNHPEYWTALARVRHRYSPQPEHGPALVNTDEEFDGITDREYGFCWGFATLVRQFTTLASYAPTQVDPAAGHPRSSRWIAYYKKKIDQVIQGRATVFPGMKNFRELSIVPELELYLKHYTIRLWSSKVVRRSSISIIKNATTPMTRSQVQALIKNLESRLYRHEMPKILFSSLIPTQPLFGLNTDIHAVLVYGLERTANGAAKIYVWDINFYAETLVRSPKFIEVLPDGTLKYEPWFDPKVPYAAKSADLSQVVIAPENDQEMVDLLLELNRPRSIGLP